MKAKTKCWKVQSKGQSPDRGVKLSDHSIGQGVKSLIKSN